MKEKKIRTNSIICLKGIVIKSEPVMGGGIVIKGRTVVIEDVSIVKQTGITDSNTPKTPRTAKNRKKEKLTLRTDYEKIKPITEWCINSVLTKGCVAEIFAGKVPMNPIVQVLSVREFDVLTPDRSLKKMISIKISDGVLDKEVFLLDSFHHLVSFLNII